MLENSVAVRELSRHVRHRSPIALTMRGILSRPTGSFRVDVQPNSFSVLTQNMALLPFPAPYLGHDRDGAVKEIISRLRDLAPDVVGLCEMFKNGERERVQSALSDVYPFFREGPDEEDLESDGGLLLLSKYPLIQQHQIIYRQCAGADCFADKGVLHIRVHPPTAPMPYDIFFSHTQNIDEDGGRDALYTQLSRLEQMIQEHSDPNIPCIVMGDLNIPGEVPEHYERLMNYLSRFVDLWTVAGNASTPGFTFVADNNFYGNESDNPHENHRLDYVLMKPGLSFIPIVHDIRVLRITREGRSISDHFGLYAEFERVVQVSQASA